MRGLAVRAHQIHRPKTPRVIEGHTPPAAHMQDDMIVFLRRRVIEVKPAKHNPGNQHPPGHAQMDQEAFARVEIGKNVFRAPPQPLDRRPLQPFGHPFRQRPPQIGAIQHRLLDPRTLHRGQ